MAYTTIDNPGLFFNTVLFTGSGSTQSITGVGFQPDWIWFKNRTDARAHALVDSIRGTNKVLRSDSANAEATTSTGRDFESFDTDGFTVNNPLAYNSFNESGDSIVAWNWSAGGSAPAITYSVKVVSDSGNKYRFDDFGTSAVTLDLQEGGTYTFDQSDSSNAGHPLRFSTTSDGTHGSGSEYTTGVVTNGTPGSSGAYTRITVAASAPQLYYYCSVHSGMGGSANTNSTFGSSNFSGSIQSKVSANTTAGFSIVSYTGTGSAATVGHGLGATPKMIIVKNLDSSEKWGVWHTGIDADEYLGLNQTNAKATNTAIWNNTLPTSSVFSVANNARTGGSDNYVAYCFADVKGYSKFGTYTGGSNPFVYLGFKPSWVMIKRTNANGTSYVMHDNKRNPFNRVDERIWVDLTNAATISSSYDIDFLSNGLKIISTNSLVNTSGGSYIYMAFAESPFVNSNGIPTNAR